jgi:AraC-like DNA-binding protein
MRLTFAERIIIEEVFHEIDNDYFRKIEIDNLCEKYEISETKLTKGFKHLYGTTIYHYHLVKCMTYAKAELEKGTTVKDLSITFEYSSAGSFARAFRKIFPQAPGYYRFIH